MNIERVFRSLCVPLLLVAMVGPLAAQEEPSFSVTGRYTAQRRPRIAVLDFEDTNASARDARYGSSVQAMLVTYLKRKSQLVVVERQKVEKVLQEWKINGQSNLLPEDPTARQLLEKVDGVIIGNVTLLGVYAEANVATKEDAASSGVGDGKVRGPRIEIDAKLLSLADGRIIAVAQRRGPVACLRSIVERLGVALEQDFLRPYYGRLKFDLAATENVRIFLTPILLDTALDEEKPPVERSATVMMGSDRDRVEPWVTDPTTYTIENLLSGWYSMRVERPGYEGVGTDNARWEGRDVYGRLQIFDRTSDEPLSRLAANVSRFVVRVDPLKTETIKGDDLGLSLRKRVGSVQVQVKRQYLDEEYTHTPRRVILIGQEKLEINQPTDMDEYADDEDCDLFEEKRPKFNDYGLTYIASTQTFDLATFKGGKLVIEDYRDQTLPIGQYEMAVWEPGYLTHLGDVTVRDGDERKMTRAVLNRETRRLALGTVGAKPESKVSLIGKETGQKIEVPLDFEAPRIQTGLPVDLYSVATNVSGLEGWRKLADLPSGNIAPPIYDRDKDLELEKRKKERKEEERRRKLQRNSSVQAQAQPVEVREEIREMPIKSSSESVGDVASQLPIVQVKTRLCIAGRIDLLKRPLDAPADDFCISRVATRVFDLLLYGQEERPEEKTAGSKVREIAAGVRERLSRGGSVQVVSVSPIEAPPGPQGTAAPAPAPPVPPVAEQEVKEVARLPQQDPVSLSALLTRDPAALREALAQFMADIDLLVLDGRDVSRLRELPEMATLVARWVEAGGALFAFVSGPGDYGRLLGAPLAVEAKGKKTDRFELAAGDGVSLNLPVSDKKKVKVKASRILPQVAKPGVAVPWRVLAFSRGRKDPRILEKGHRDRLGYVLVWLENPDSFRGRWGGTVPAVDSARSQVEERVLGWARYLMYRRYDKAGNHLRQAEGALSR